MVQKAWARTARVTWRCQPVNERPSKWSSPRPVFSSRSRARSATGSWPAAPARLQEGRRAGWRASNRWAHRRAAAIRQQPALWEAAVIGAGDVPVGGPDPDRQEVTGHRGVRVAFGGLGALPPGHLPDLAGLGDGELAQVHRGGGAGGLAR